MKHYHELIELETQIINLDVLNSVVKVVAQGMENASQNDIGNTMYHIEDQMERIHSNLRTKFNILFDIIREESFKDEAKTRKHKTKKPL